jgi:hypothetical protein
METPNTRSRRKRDLESVGGNLGSSGANSQEDGERVVWQHDQRVRRAIVSAIGSGELKLLLEQTPYIAVAHPLQTHSSRPRLRSGPNQSRIVSLRDRPLHPPCHSTVLESHHHPRPRTRVNGRVEPIDLCLLICMLVMST